MNQDLIDAIIESEKALALSALNRLLILTENSWEIHNSLFPVVQRVLNPPFINPHMPKMFAIIQEFLPYLEPGDLPSLIRLEVMEYVKRDKLDRLNKPGKLPDPGNNSSRISFKSIEEAIRQKDRNKTAALMAVFVDKQGKKKFAVKLLLLGSGYLNRSLGHSVSCTAFILLEMMRRTDQDPWPVLALLADYFCKGGFTKTPKIKKTGQSGNKAAYLEQLKRSVRGTGVVELHHTITLYAIEQTRHLFNDQEYRHMLGMWESFMGEKQGYLLDETKILEKPSESFDAFFEMFSRLDTPPVAGSLFSMMSIRGGEKQLGCFLIKAVCRLYRGGYDPHFLTGLGSVLWVKDHFQDQPSIVFNAIYQYVDYFFGGIKKIYQ